MGSQYRECDQVEEHLLERDWPGLPPLSPPITSACDQGSVMQGRAFCPHLHPMCEHGPRGDTSVRMCCWRTSPGNVQATQTRPSVSVWYRSFGGAPSWPSVASVGSLEPLSSLAVRKRPPSAALAAPKSLSFSPTSAATGTLAPSILLLLFLVFTCPSQKLIQISFSQPGQSLPDFVPHAAQPFFLLLVATRRIK